MDECNAAGCPVKATHTLRFKWVKYEKDVIIETSYCLNDALYFYAWLMYAYPGDYEMIGIFPPLETNFRRNYEDV